MKLSGKVAHHPYAARGASGLADRHTKSSTLAERRPGVAVAGQAASMTAKAHRIRWSESGARSLLSTSASTAAIRPRISDVSRPFTDHLIDIVGSDAPSSQASLDAFQHLVNKHNPGDENARNLFEEEIDAALQDKKTSASRSP